ncbi:hypothetical protein OUZ56_032612 [Daphnia magna]|uniref:Serpin domain-containing protein n=1 Tax=Daphnia magna TaxID=35525 RepID=A0ABR0B9E9_9CRUS|nr:hypothetical protein OUZ56_032612 [Daphnia magna]
MHLRTLRLAALPLLALAACADDPVVAADFEEARSSLARDAASSIPEDASAVVAANTTFGLALNRGLVKTGENVVLSPASISSALAMAYGGAQGETARAFEAVLGFDGHTHPGMNSIDLALATRAGDGRAVDGTPLKFAGNNALFAQKGYPFKTTYLDLLARNYGAGIKLANFRTDPEGERGRINSFVAAKTEQKIKDLLPAGSIDTITRAVLVNTVYMNAAWATPFDASLTEDATFRGELATSSVKMMHREGPRAYAADAHAEAATLPYDGGKLALTAILPRTDLATFDTTFDAAELDALSRPATSTQDPAHPFRRCSAIPGRSAQKLGLGVALSSSADFSGIADPTAAQETLHIGQVVHKVYLDVAEKGTEAAAATAVTLDGTTSVQDPPKKMTFDRPFYVVIRDVPTGMVLFTARIVKL